MNSQEAADELQYAINLIKQDGKDWLDERDIPVLEMTISSLEKQIPKKPKMPLDAYWTCQMCGGVVEPSHKYCKRCGQAIDWKENR